MLRVFKYKGFEPISELRKLADVSIEQIANLSGEGATIVARAEFDGQEYGCSIDIFQSFGSLYVFVAGSDPRVVIERAVAEMKLKLLSPQDISRQIYLKLKQRKTKETFYQ